jgi:CcmD family protein
MRYLIAAYVLTWVIHGGYLVILARKYAKIQREIKTLNAYGKKP